MEILAHQMIRSDPLVHLLCGCDQFQRLLFRFLSQVSKSFMNPSTISSTNFRFWWLDKSCLVEFMWRSSSMEAYKSSSPNRLFEIDFKVDGDAFSIDFNLLNCSSSLRVVGWDLEGKIRGEETMSVGFYECPAWQLGNGRRECPVFVQITEKGQLDSCFELSLCFEYKIEAAQISPLESKFNAFTEAFFKLNVELCLLSLQSCRILKNGTMYCSTTLFHITMTTAGRFCLETAWSLGELKGHTFEFWECI